MAAAKWEVLEAAFSNMTGGLSLEGTNHADGDKPFFWNISHHSLENDGWRRYDWRNTVWADAKARATFERLAGVSVVEAGLT